MANVKDITRESWILNTFPEWGTWLNEEIEEEVVPENNVAMWWLGNCGVWFKTPGGANIVMDLWSNRGKHTKKVKDMSYMFSVSNSPQRLKTIYVSDNFVVDNVTNWNYVFAGQVTLRGGSGSYLNNPSLADKSWLRIDDPTNGRPGYFTRKP